MEQWAGDNPDGNDRNGEDKDSWATTKCDATLANLEYLSMVRIYNLFSDILCGLEPQYIRIKFLMTALFEVL